MLYQFSIRNIIILTLFMALSGCAELHSRSGKPGGPPTYMLYSPNGEPLNGGPLGRPTCPQALSGWFDRVRGAAQTISRDAFMVDAETQFHRMDIDKNGYLVSEELDRFRAPYRQEAISAKQDADEEKGSQSQKGRHKHKDDSKSGGDQGAAHLFDPVMSADTNLDFQVTLTEFMTQANENFARLDSNHDGALSESEVLATCQEKEKH